MTSTPFFKRVIFSVKNIPVTLTSMFLLTILACLYSYFIGRNNAENFYVSIPLAERYARLPEGLINQYTYKLGQPLLIGMIIVNFIIIAMSNPSGEAKKMFVFLKWFFAISIFYILLLPLGGFRPYRPNIIRYDTIMPITLASVFLYGYSTYYILMNLKTKSKKVIYAFVILIFSAIYINADFGFGVKKYSLCERESLEKFVASPDSVVFIDTDCSILNWGKTLNPDDSRGRAELLLHWNIIKNKKLYYQK
nr:hypothetical protein [Bacteroidota bacterium]